MSIRRHHDMGGLTADTVVPSEHDFDIWEKRVDAIVKLLSDSKRRILSTDELRRAMEDLGPGVYDELSYYERWITGATNLLLEKGLITIDELGAKMSDVERRWTEDRETPAV